MMKATMIGFLLLFSCSANPAQMTATYDQPVLVHSGPRLDAGDPAAGRTLFTKLRCDSCHSVAGNPGKSAHPLPDLSAEPPYAVAALIIQRTDVAPEALFDEMAMASAASRVTPQELAHLVAYLRHPATRR
jgi:mono/diheme cytochrome c family protein